MPRRSGDDDVGKSRGVALATRPIGHGTCDPRCWRVEGKNTIAIEVEERFPPCRQIGTLARRAFTPQLCDSIFDFRKGHGR